MKNLRPALAALLAVSPIAGCATGPVEPVCRAPNAAEMAVFRAVIAHDETRLTDLSAPGAARAALEAGDQNARTHVWGGQGYAGGTVIGLLMAPPLCVIDMPGGDEQQRTALVYTQARYAAVRPPEGTPPGVVFTPYGRRMQDYLPCRFVNTGEGWRLTDLCGFSAPAAPVS
ncbi:MAG: hypothetical protein KIS81_01575 [Maricaulaceae bacterium]|nr:hypothetical protein [Maricaulaceae bacterium]